MSIRVEVQLDHESESLRFVARATLEGEPLHEVGKHGGTEVQDELLRKMAEWLEGRGHPVPDHYWLQQFTPKEQWLQQLFPK